MVLISQQVLKIDIVPRIGKLVTSPNSDIDRLLIKQEKGSQF